MVRVLFLCLAGCLPVSPFPPAYLAADISLRHIHFLCLWPDECTSFSGAVRVPCYNTPRRAACQYIEPLACRRSTFSGALEDCLRLLVWTSARVLGAGHVEQRSNGGGWAQDVCRGQSSIREELGVCEGASRIEGRAATEKRHSRQIRIDMLHEFSIKQSLA